MLKPLLYSRLNDRPSGSSTTKNICRSGPFDRVRKADEPKWDRTFPELLRFEPADLYVIKGRHKIGGDLSRFLFRYGVGRILFTGFNHVLKCTTILRRTSVPKQLDGHGWNRQQEDDQDRSEAGHGAVVSPDWRLDVANFLHEITKCDRRVLESMSEVVDRIFLTLAFLSRPAHSRRSMCCAWLGVAHNFAEVNR
jgi:hypothetical protein